MRKNHSIGLVLGGAALLVLAGCVPRAPQPAPAPTPPPRVYAPRPAPVVTRRSSDWRDQPITPGVWSWAREGSLSVARFAGGMLTLRCDRASGVVTIARQGSATAAVPVTIVTTSRASPLTAEPEAGPPPALAVRLAARDPLLDAMAFSRGRFAVETTGLPTIYAPSWPEVARVIEDCR